MQETFTSHPLLIVFILDRSSCALSLAHRLPVLVFDKSKRERKREREEDEEEQEQDGEEEEEGGRKERTYNTHTDTHTLAV